MIAGRFRQFDDRTNKNGPIKGGFRKITQYPSSLKFKKKVFKSNTKFPELAFGFTKDKSKFEFSIRVFE